MIAIMLGLPASGKGTQAKLLAKNRGLIHLSTGEMLRSMINLGNELGKTAKGYVESGNLVPDELMIDIVNTRIDDPDCNNGMIMDGYPRTINQTENFKKKLFQKNKKIDIVIYLNVAIDLLKTRISGRRVSPSSGREYHIKYNPPKVAGICDVDGSKLIQRADDMPDKVENRLKVYYERTAPLIDYFANDGLLLEIDGSSAPDIVASEIKNKTKHIN